MQLRSTLVLPLALASVLSAGAAQAASHASASISNFHFTLIDLDPQDGIAASLETVRPYSAYDLGKVEYQYYHEYPIQSGREEAYQPSQWQPVTRSKSLEYPNATPATSLSVSAAVLGSSLETRSVTASASVDNDSALGIGFGQASIPVHLRLSPKTSLTITFDLSSTASHPGLDSPGLAASSAYVRLEWHRPDANYEYFILSRNLGGGTDPRPG